MPKTTKQLALAHEHLRQGNLARARSLYGRLVDRDPQNAEAWHWLGIVSARGGDLAAAALFVGRAIQISGPIPALCASLGRILARLDQPQQASACFRQALAGNPLNPVFALELGLTLSASDQPEDALLALQHATELDVSNPEAWFHLGCMYHRTSDFERAGQSYQRSLALNSSRAEAWFNLGVVRMVGEHNEEALASFRRCVELDSGHAEAYNNLGLLEQETGNLDVAIECFRRALRLRSGEYYAAEYNLARGLAMQESLESAREVYEKVVSTRPEHVDARLGLANTLVGLGLPEQALPHLRSAVETSPNSVPANLNLGVTLLKLGQWKEGWPFYGWRQRRSETSARHSDHPVWNGSPLEGKRILLHSEQGFGDTIQFARYLPMVRDRGGVPILECQPSLVGLMWTLDGVEEVVADGDPLPRFDCHAPLMALPEIFESTTGNVPAGVPCLLGDSVAVETWGARLRSEVDPACLRVGLTWAGNPHNKYERYRAVPVELFATLAELEGIEWFSLQKNAAMRPALRLHPMIERCSNFADNAAAMMNLDLVISVDTAIAHLAGALARPVWTLLPFAADWRWLTERSDTPWYPTMRLFRQRQRGDWSPVIESIRSELQEISSVRRR